MRRLLRLLGLLLPLTGTAACLVIVGVGPSSAVGVPPLVLSPTHLSPTPVDAFSCPGFPPWSGTIVIRFGEGDDSFERQGLPGPTAVFDRSTLGQRFGSLTWRDHHRTGFSFVFRFGCATSASGTIFIAVRLRSGDGRIHEASGSVNVG
jgi:hypothetical protein